eukprot:COSAG06_NODE_5980_length_3171_cov_1.201823_1_plen_784_part_01
MHSITQTVTELSNRLRPKRRSPIIHSYRPKRRRSSAIYSYIQEEDRGNSLNHIYCIQGAICCVSSVHPRPRLHGEDCPEPAGWHWTPRYNALARAPGVAPPAHRLETSPVSRELAGRQQCGWVCGPIAISRHAKSSACEASPRGPRFVPRILPAATAASSQNARAASTSRQTTRAFSREGQIHHAVRWVSKLRACRAIGSEYTARIMTRTRYVAAHVGKRLGAARHARAHRFSGSHAVAAVLLLVSEAAAQEEFTSECSGECCGAFANTGCCDPHTSDPAREISVSREAILRREAAAGGYVYGTELAKEFQEVNAYGDALHGYRNVDTPFAPPTPLHFPPACSPGWYFEPLVFSWNTDGVIRSAGGSSWEPAFLHHPDGGSVGRPTLSPGSGTCAQCPAGSYSPTDCAEKRPPPDLSSCVFDGTTSEVFDGACGTDLGLLTCDSCVRKDGCAGELRCTADTGELLCTSTQRCGLCVACGLADCLVCPAGKYSPNPGEVNAEACVACEPGQFSFVGAAACSSTCPAGYISTATTAACSRCEAGRFPETESDGTAECVACAEGKYLPHVPLPTNMHELTANTHAYVQECRNCMRGTYQPEPAATTCISCANGQYQPDLGSSSQRDCINCPRGTYICKPRARFPGFDSTCSKSQQPTAALARTASMQESDCIACPAGQYNDDAGSTSSLACKHCYGGVLRPAEAEEGCTCPPGVSVFIANDIGNNSSQVCYACGLARSTRSDPPLCASCDGDPLQVTGELVFEQPLVCAPCPDGSMLDPISGECIRC